MRLAAEETHDSLQHSNKRKQKKTTLSGFLLGFPLSELLNAGQCISAVCQTHQSPLEQKKQTLSDSLQAFLLLQIRATICHALGRALLQLLCDVDYMQAKLALGL